MKKFELEFDLPAWLCAFPTFKALEYYLQLGVPGLAPALPASLTWRVMPCVPLWEEKLELVFLVIALCLTYFLLRLHWAWDCCRWNKYSIRLNLSPVNMALSNVLKEMPTTYWTALGPKPSRRAVVPPSQAPSEAGVSAPSLLLPKE